MAIIEIRDILNNETGETIFPRTHVNAVIGLKDTSFFEAVQDEQDPTKFSVKLKSEYTGLWAEGWMAAGGVGSDSGGGGVSFLKELSDVYHDDSNVLRADGTGVQPGDALVYDTTLGWVAAAQSGGISSVILSAGSVNGTLKLTVNGVAGSDVAVPGLGELAYMSVAGLSNSFLPISGGTLTGDLRLKGGSNYGRALLFGNGTNVFLLEDTDDHLQIYGNKGIELSTGSGYGVTINGTPLDWFTVETVNGSPTLKLNTRYAGLWAEGWLAAGGIGSGSGGGGVSSLYALDEVSPTTNPSTNDVFYYNGTLWTSTSVRTVLGQSIIGIGDITYTETDPAYTAWIGTSRTKNYVFAAPSSANGTPSFRALVDEDIPSLTTSKISDIESWISGKGYALNSALTEVSNRVTSIERWFEIVTVNGTYALHAKNNYAIYSDSWIAAGGVGSGSGGGGYIDVDSELSTTSENPVQNKVITTALGTKANASEACFIGDIIATV